MYSNFEISLVVFMPNITTNLANTYTNSSNSHIFVLESYLPRLALSGVCMIDCDFPIFLNDNSQNEGRTQHRRSAKKLHQPVAIRIEAESGSTERQNIRNRRPRRSRTKSIITLAQRNLPHCPFHWTRVTCTLWARLETAPKRIWHPGWRAEGRCCLYEK